MLSIKSECSNIEFWHTTGSERHQRPVDLHATVLVPGRIGAGRALHELGEVSCLYAGRLLGCSGGAIATGRVEVDHVALHGWDASPPSVELLFYE